jgi:hypothetical protein
MNYNGYLREEEEEYQVSGTEWGESACFGMPCPVDDEPVVLDFPEGDYRRNNSKRIDMAAVINEHAAPCYDFECRTNEKDLEATNGDMGTLQTREEWSANGSYDLKSEEESEERGFMSGLCICSPCKSRFLFIAFTLFALFVTGLGIGLAVRDGPTERNSFAASTGAGETGGPMNSTGSSATPAPAPQSLDGSSTTPEPTYFEFDLDYDFEELEDQSNVGFQQTETNNSPYLVGAYYYPW